MSITINHPYKQSLHPNSRRCADCGELEMHMLHAVEAKETCKVAKADVQQLKSVRDDLANRFKENDKLHNDVAKLSTSVAANTRKRLKRKLDKLTSQITAINRIIKHLETHTK